jgi:BioD-like phosphotransacetylase family protein
MIGFLVMNERNALCFIDVEWRGVSAFRYIEGMRILLAEDLNANEEMFNTEIDEAMHHRLRECNSLLVVQLDPQDVQRAVSEVVVPLVVTP